MFWSHPNITEECEQYVSAKGGLGTVTSWFARELRGFTSFACTSFHAAPGGILLLPKGVCNLFGGLNSFVFFFLRFATLSNPQGLRSTDSNKFVRLCPKNSHVCSTSSSTSIRAHCVPHLGMYQNRGIRIVGDKPNNGTLKGKKTLPFWPEINAQPGTLKKNNTPLC